MEAKRRAELYAEVCMMEEHEDIIAVPIADLRELLADSRWRDQVEPQVIARTSDVPSDAVAWIKEEGRPPGHYFPSWLVPFREGWERGDALEDAPDYLPDNPFPASRAIVDLGRD